MRPIPSVASQGSLETEELSRITAQVDSVLGEPLYWFPVRHHSPAVSRNLLLKLDERKPRLIFLEAPFETQELIPAVVASDTRPPVAIYSSFRDDANALESRGLTRVDPEVPIRLSSFYPLLEYSPEYVALRWAQSNSARVVFIDLPHYAAVTGSAETALEEDAEDPTEKEDTGDPQDTGSAATDIAIPKNSLQKDTVGEQAIIEGSRFYQHLAQAAGYRHWDEAWDSLFEDAGTSMSPDDFRHELATFCCAVRATANQEWMIDEDTLPRERFMWKTIKDTLRESNIDPSKAMVVCGGFHLFLNRDDPVPPPEIPAGTVYTSVVPYSFFRVSELSGYGAGNRAPQFYQRLWNLTKGGRPDDLLAEHVVDVLKNVRKEGEIASSADAISVSQHARMLANLRGRRAPILDDIHDAIITCCCKGDPNDVGISLKKAIDTTDIGTRIGKVTSKQGRLPIVADFHQQIEFAGLGEFLTAEKRGRIHLDTREKGDSNKSVLLHRLAYLEIPFAVRLVSRSSGSGSGTLFREHWQMQWSPNVEPALVEQALFGDSLETAVLARFRAEFAADSLDAARVCERLFETLNLGLPALVPTISVACRRAIDHDVRFTSLAQGLHWLRLLDQRADLCGLDRTLLQEMMARAYDRACFAIPDVANVPQDQHQSILSGLLTIAGCIGPNSDQEFAREHFTSHVRQAADVTAVPFIRGVMLGLLTELKELDSTELAQEIGAYASAQPDVMATAGDFVDGVLAASRSSLLMGADLLVTALDPVIKSAPWETFLQFLPRLRNAFERLHRAQVEGVAKNVAELYGLSQPDQLTDLRTSSAAATWLVRLDQKVGEILKSWEI